LRVGRGPASEYVDSVTEMDGGRVVQPRRQLSRAAVALRRRNANVRSRSVGRGQTPSSIARFCRRNSRGVPPAWPPAPSPARSGEQCVVSARGVGSACGSNCAGGGRTPWIAVLGGEDRAGDARQHTGEHEQEHEYAPTPSGWPALHLSQR
jgi:hypothetical protein